MLNSRHVFLTPLQFDYVVLVHCFSRLASFKIQSYHSVPLAHAGETPLYLHCQRSASDSMKQDYLESLNA
jgi:hypothetical protein